MGRACGQNSSGCWRMGDKGGRIKDIGKLKHAARLLAIDPEVTAKEMTGRGKRRVLGGGVDGQKEPQANPKREWKKRRG